MRLFWLALLWLSLSLCAGAEQSLRPALEGSRSLAGHMELLEGTAGSLEEAIQAGKLGRFRPLPGNLSKGYGNGEVWLRLSLGVASAPPFEAYLELAPFYLQEATLFVPQRAGGYQALQSGTRVPFHLRALPYRNVVFPLGGPDQGLPAGEPITCYLRVRTRSNLIIKPVLWSPPAFLDAAIREGIFFGAFFGIALIMLVANIIQWFIVRERLKVYYAAYLSSVILYFGGTEGFFSQYLLPGKPWVGAYLGQLSLAFFPMLTVRLFSTLLDLKASHPAWDRWLLRVSSLITLAATVAILFGHYFRVTAALQVSLLLLGWGTMGFTALMALRRNQQALLYLLAFGPYTLGATLRIMRNFTWLPPGYLSEYGVQIGAFFHICLMTLPQAHLVRRMKRERDAALRASLEAAEHHAQNLEGEVEARTAELRAQQALTAQALGQERTVVNEQRHFLHMVSHEFRTPLAVIDGAAQMIRLAKDSEEVANRTKTIQRGVHRMTHLLLTWLTRERLAEGLWVLHPEPVAMPAWLQHVADQALKLAVGRELIVQAEGLPPVCHFDRELMETALGNLLDNAFKYSPTQAAVTLQGGQREGCLCLEVVDRGPGLPTDPEGQIGTRFFRGSNAQRTPGLGLGLNLVRTIAEHHRGRLEVDTAAGQGTTVRLLLPCLQPQAEKDSGH